jgi:type II secretion system protein H
MDVMLAHRSRPRKLGNWGFTLVEILVVVLILGIASAIIIPQIGSRDDLVVSAAARVVMSDLIYAQNRSIATQKRHFVQFSGQTYTVMTRDSDVQPLYAINHPVTKNTYAATFGAPNTGLERVALGTVNFGGQTIVAFDELGSPYSFDGSTMTPLINSGTIIVSAGVASLTISVEPYTGEATVD